METNLFVSDLHTNSTVALIHPKNVLDDGGGYKLSDTQKWLYEKWQVALEQVKANITGELYTHFLGDLVDIDAKGRSVQTVTRHPTTPIEWTHDLIEPLCQWSTGVSFFRGTAAHVGANGYTENTLARMFDNAMRDPNTGQPSWWWMEWHSSAVTFDLAHHPATTISGRSQLSYGGIDRLASDTVFMYANDLRRDPPDYIIRGHLHRHRDSIDHFRTRAIILPSWSSLTEFNYRKGITVSESVGMVLVFTDGDKSEVRNILFKPDPPHHYSGSLHKLLGSVPDEDDD